MSEPFTEKLARASLKCATFWQSVLRFGLPLVLLSRLEDYVGFRISAGRTGLSYPWGFHVMLDLAVMFFVSALWWWLMRELIALKRKNEQG